MTAACSEPLVVELDRLQVETDQGPCLDAMSEAGSMYAVDLARDARWRRFGPATVDAGIRNVIGTGFGSDARPGRRSARRAASVVRWPTCRASTCLSRTISSGAAAPAAVDRYEIAEVGALEGSTRDLSA